MSEPESMPAVPPARDEPEACPRCGQVLSSDLYGPCPACVAELRSNQRQAPSRRAEVAFEPAMHVTPNAVALKE